MRSWHRCCGEQLPGVPGLVGYRAANTLDAMVGYRSKRYLRFGWASARLDDLLNLVPARVAAALTVASAPLVGGRWGQAWKIWRRDGSRHPSPNAGPVEAAGAGGQEGPSGSGPERTAPRSHRREGPTPMAQDVTRVVGP